MSERGGLEMDGGVAEKRPFARMVRQRREELPLTQEKLAERADVSVAMIRRSEAGKTTPHQEHVEKIAKGLGLSPEGTPDDYAALVAAWRQQRRGVAERNEEPADSSAPGRRRRSRRAVAISAGAVLIVALVVAAILIDRRNDPSGGVDHYATPADFRLGGLWSTPRTDGFVLTGNTTRLIAHAFAKGTGAPPVSYVVFTAHWPALGDDWRVLCEVRQPNAGSDEYECPVDLVGEGIPNGTIEFSFDVYDARGFHHNSAHGIRRGRVER